MKSTTLSAGDPIEARCTKCRKITNHIVVAMTEAGPAKVQCNTCSGQHKYRPPVAPKKSAVRKTADPKIAEQKEWQKLLPEMEGKDTVDYAMTKTFKVGALINHAKFGVGVVKKVLGEQKVEVLFEDGIKKMRCL